MPPRKANSNFLRYPLALALAFFSFISCASAEASLSAVPSIADSGAASLPNRPAPVAFSEIWAYLQNGDEQSLDSSWPISDIGYFGASINYRGKLYGVPNRKSLGSFSGRTHLVIAEVTNQALNHFCIDPSMPIRNELLASIIEASSPYDGVQIDFELVPASDAEQFYSFLSELKHGIGKKTLSVAIPARTRNVGDAYDYARISAIADRVIVMAYDEHWSGSGPGSIASLAWCQKVAAYAVSVIGYDKLVMGLPFYGRAWAETSLSKAYRFSGISRLLTEKNVSDMARVDSVPSFSYSETVNVTVFYEDEQSIRDRAAMYRSSSVRAISFWKIGQEDPNIWASLELSR